MPSCRHHLDLCPDCGGLRVVEMRELTGVTGFTLRTSDGQVLSAGNPQVHVGPVPGPCPNPAIEETDRV